MSDGLKPHTHEDRKKIIEQLLPQIKERFGENLIALVALASFARNDDGPYSDLEMTAFLKNMPINEKKNGVGIIYDGMLIELDWTTKERYIEDVGMSLHWFRAGSDTLLPIINETYITEVKSSLKNFSDDERLAFAKYQSPIFFDILKAY